MPNGVALITSPGQAATVIEDARNLSEKAFIKQDNGGELTQEEKANVLQAAKDFQALSIFNPTFVTHAFGEGRCYQAVEAWEAAEAQYRRAILNGELDHSEEGKMTVPEAHYRLSQVRFHFGDYENALEEADRAVKVHPDSPNYLAAKASALIQLNRLPEAAKIVQQALALDPTHRQSLELQKLLAAPAKPGG